MEENTKNRCGRKSIPKRVLEARREYIAGLRSAGVSMTEIHEQINMLASEREWGNVTLRTVERDVAKYYEKRNLIKPEDYEDFFALREAHLAQMELTIEELSLYIANKKNWKPFEHPNALARLSKMQMRYAELQNWNLTKKNMDFDFRHKELNPLLR